MIYIFFYQQLNPDSSDIKFALFFTVFSVGIVSVTLVRKNFSGVIARGGRIQGSSVRYLYNYV